MAAPLKKGLDYFSCDCNFEDNVELVIAEFGLKGLGVLVRLWQKVYGFGGYYCVWNRDVALMFASKNQVGVNAVEEILRACFKRGVFDRELFERCGILTSKGIQKRYLEATKRRKDKGIRAEYLLIDLPCEAEDVTQNAVNVCNNAQNDSNYRQSKGKQRKAKQSEGKQARARQSCRAPSLEEVKAFAAKERLALDCERFYHYYSATGWKAGANRIADWQAKARQWSAEDAQKGGEQPSYDIAKFERYLEQRELVYGE